MKLFEVIVTKTIYILAEDEAEAEVEASIYENEEDGDARCAGEVTSLSQVDEEWKDSLPYGGEGDVSIRDLLTAPDPIPPFVDPPEQLRMFPDGGQPT